MYKTTLLQAIATPIQIHVSIEYKYTPTPVHIHSLQYKYNNPRIHYEIQKNRRSGVPNKARILA